VRIHAKNLFPLVALALVSVWPPNLLLRGDQPSLPSPAFIIHFSDVRASAISPDEKSLTVLVVNSAGAAVQVWDFVTNSLVQSRSLPAPQLRPHSSGPAVYVRYTSDGELLAVYTGDQLLHVLRSIDLEELRTIRFGSPTGVTAFDMSPVDRRVAVRMAGDVRVYELDSGDLVRSWRILQRPEFRMSELLRIDPRLDGPGLAWREDGQALAISVADNSPCYRGGGTIYGFDLSSSKIANTFRVPLLSTSIAFGSGTRLYVTSNTCGGVFTHWALDLPIYDSNSGRETGKILAGKVGIRDYLTISANKRFLLAFADRQKTTFEGFEDTLRTTDEQWQVWDLTDAKLVLSSPALAQMQLGRLPALSATGRFVYGTRAQEVVIFTVPVAEK
jgi:WD40 repeat protein